MRSRLFGLLKTGGLTAQLRPHFFSNWKSHIITGEMIETRHLAKGSVNPPVTKGLIRIYNMRFCPYAQRILLILNAKKIPFEIVNVDLMNKPDWLFEKSPLGKVPALEQDGKILFESLIIADYLDEQYPQVPLYPKDPFEKAKDRIQIDTFNKAISYMLGMLLNPAKMNQEFFEKLLNEIDLFEKELKARGGRFFGGSAPNMVDLMLWPWFERVELLKMVGGDTFAFPGESRFAKLTAWAKNMKNDEGVQVTFLSPEIHGKYLTGRISGETDYDFLVSNL